MHLGSKGADQPAHGVALRMWIWYGMCRLLIPVWSPMGIDGARAGDLLHLSSAWPSGGAAITTHAGLLVLGGGMQNISTLILGGYFFAECHGGLNSAGIPI